jgi:hypothetical protein
VHVVVISAYGVDFRTFVVEYANEVGVKALFNLKEDFGFTIFCDEHEMENESA